MTWLGRQGSQIFNLQNATFWSKAAAFAAALELCPLLKQLVRFVPMRNAGLSLAKMLAGLSRLTGRLLGFEKQA